MPERFLRRPPGPALALALALLLPGGGGNAPAFAGDEPAAAAEAKPPEPPQVLLATPFLFERGKATPCLLRGLRLDDVQSIRSEPGIEVVIGDKGEAKVPEGWKPEQMGNRQVACTVTLSADLPADRSAARLVLETAGGLTASVEIALAPAGSVLDECEPNSGFRDAQPIAPGRNVRGFVAANKDVDAYRFEAAAGDKVRVAVTARGRGSALDPLLTLYDSRGFERARSDDTKGADDRDAGLDFAVPASGRWFVIVQDAHDTGSDTHAYLLRLTSPPSEP